MSATCDGHVLPGSDHTVWQVVVTTRSHTLATRAGVILYLHVLQVAFLRNGRGYVHEDDMFQRWCPMA